MNLKVHEVKLEDGATYHLRELSAKHAQYVFALFKGDLDEAKIAQGILAMTWCNASGTLYCNGSAEAFEELPFKHMLELTKLAYDLNGITSGND